MNRESCEFQNFTGDNLNRAKFYWTGWPRGFARGTQALDGSLFSTHSTPTQRPLCQDTRQKKMRFRHMYIRVCSKQTLDISLSPVGAVDVLQFCEGHPSRAWEPLQYSHHPDTKIPLSGYTTEEDKVLPHVYPSLFQVNSWHQPLTSRGCGLSTVLTGALEPWMRSLFSTHTTPTQRSLCQDTWQKKMRFHHIADVYLCSEHTLAINLSPVEAVNILRFCLRCMTNPTILMAGGQRVCSEHAHDISLSPVGLWTVNGLLPLHDKQRLRLSWQVVKEFVLHTLLTSTFHQFVLSTLLTSTFHQFVLSTLWTSTFHQFVLSTLLTSTFHQFVLSMLWTSTFHQFVLSMLLTFTPVCSEHTLDINLSPLCSEHALSINLSPVGLWMVYSFTSTVQQALWLSRQVVDHHGVCW